MRVLLSIILALIMLFFLGCHSFLIKTNPDSPQDEHSNIRSLDYETHAQSSFPRIDSLGIWEYYMESNMYPSCRFYFDNGKLKRWGPQVIE
jgi:hypothetical protein